MCLQAELNGVEPPVTTPKIEMTANEIALLIRSESDLAMPWPRGAEVTVHGAGERRWTAKCYSPDPVRDAQFSWKIRQIADKLRQRFDLKLH